MGQMVTPDAQGARLRRLGLGLLAALAAGCGPGGPRGGPPPGGRPTPDGPVAVRRGDLNAQSDMVRVLQGLGVIASGLPLPFTGQIASLAGSRPDSALVLVSLSFPTQAFTFVREQDRFRATYNVTVEARQNGTVVARAESNETVRVLAFKETQRTDESILFQQRLTMPPGTYTMTVLVRDGATSRSVQQEKNIVVPRYGSQPSTPIVAFEATPRSSASAAPELLANTRGTIVLGRDAELSLYLEVRDSAQAGVPLEIAIRDDKGTALWQNTVTLPHRGELASSMVRIPVGTLGVGIVRAAVWRPGQPDTVSQSLLISFGDDVPVASFDEMIGYLRYFASGARLNSLKTGTPQQRAEAWAAFLRETDPITITPQNEALRDYFQRIRSANERFREDAGAGWLSDRGAVYVAFGEPDQILNNNGQISSDISVGQRGRIQQWDYTNERVRLYFIDQSGFGRWRFYGNSSSEFMSALQRRLNR